MKFYNQSWQNSTQIFYTNYIYYDIVKERIEERLISSKSHISQIFFLISYWSFWDFIILYLQFMFVSSVKKIGASFSITISYDEWKITITARKWHHEIIIDNDIKNEKQIKKILSFKLFLWFRNIVLTEIYSL